MTMGGVFGVATALLPLASGFVLSRYPGIALDIGLGIIVAGMLVPIGLAMSPRLANPLRGRATVVRAVRFLLIVALVTPALGFIGTDAGSLEKGILGVAFFTYALLLQALLDQTPALRRDASWLLLFVPGASIHAGDIDEESSASSDWTGWTGSFGGGDGGSCWGDTGGDDDGGGGD